MKNGPFKIRIDNPCTEDWSAMKSVERGKYCNSCQKAVTDFSSFTDKEIFNYINQRSGEKLCGRFSQQQLSRELYPEFKQSSYSSMLKVAASIFLGALSSLPAHSQERDSANVENTISQSPMASRQIRINGQVTSADSSGVVSGATISIAGLDSTTSDSSGYFELDIFTPLDSIELTIAAKGWETQRSHVKLDQLLLGHCSVLEKDLALKRDEHDFQWEVLELDSTESIQDQQIQFPLEITTMFMGSMIMTPNSANCNYYTQPEPDPRDIFRYVPRSNANALQQTSKHDPETYIKNTPKGWQSPLKEPQDPTVPFSAPRNKDAVLPNESSDREEEAE